MMGGNQMQALKARNGSFQKEGYAFKTISSACQFPYRLGTEELSPACPACPQISDLAALPVTRANSLAMSLNGLAPLLSPLGPAALTRLDRETQGLGRAPPQQDSAIEGPPLAPSLTQSCLHPAATRCSSCCLKGHQPTSGQHNWAG